MALKRIVAPRQAPVLALAAPTRANAAAKKTTIAPHKFSAPTDTVVEAEQRPNLRPRFACGADVEVRRGLPQVSGKRRLVIYTRAKVVSASAGTDSYLVQYPAAGSIPCRTARVPAWDVRAARRVPPPATVDVAPRASSKRPSSSTDRSESGGDCDKKARTGKGVPEDALLRFIQEHEEQELKKKARGYDGKLVAAK